MGRTSDMANGAFTDYEFQVPIVVLTYRELDEAAKVQNDRLAFTFVADRIERAIAQAQAASGDRDVTVLGGASTILQCLAAGLVDELHIDLRAVLLGDVRRLFDLSDAPPVEVETIRLTESPASRTCVSAS
jgi:dihydrofolate reductase